MRLGKLHGIPTPFNRTLQRLVSEMARRRQTPGKYTADELYDSAEPMFSSNPN